MSGEPEAVSLIELTPEQRQAIKIATGDLGLGVTKPAKTKPEKKKLDGAITRIDVASAKERVFVVNGIKFFAAVASAGHRILSACDENKKTLESAARVLMTKGYDTKVKRDRKEKSLWLLEAREKVPSGPWPDEDQAKTDSVGK